MYPSCVVGETAQTTLRRPPEGNPEGLPERCLKPAGPAEPVQRAPRRRLDAYISRRPSMARASVAWSAYSSSPPMGTPVAMRVVRTPRGRSSLDR